MTDRDNTIEAISNVVTTQNISSSE